ncbi:MAG: hypothetical protein ACAI25_01180 [Planctomycetota bacterium]
MPKKDEEPSAFARASERVKSVAQTAAVAALDGKKAKSMLAFKLIVVGLTLTALAGGFDYFSHDDAIHKVVSGFAREAHYDKVAEAVDSWDVTITRFRAATLERLPEGLRDHLAGAALAIGVLMLGSGLRIKIREHHPVHGHVLRDVGRAIAGPGFVGVIVFVLLSFHGALIIRRSFSNVYRQLQSGQMAWGDLGKLAERYTPWAYDAVGTVLWIGVVLAVVAIAARISESRIERGRLPLEVARRTCAWAAALALGYFACAVAIATVSFGGALNVIAWPWKVDPGAFLTAMVFMSFGMGLDRTGTRMIKREQAEKEPPKDEKKKKKAEKKA